MLSYSGITVLSFANKVVKVQPRKFVRSLHGVPRMLQYLHDLPGLPGVVAESARSLIPGIWGFYVPKIWNF